MDQPGSSCCAPSSAAPSAPSGASHVPAHHHAAAAETQAIISQLQDMALDPSMEQCCRWDVRAGWRAGCACWRAARLTARSTFWPSAFASPHSIAQQQHQPPGGTWRTAYSVSASATPCSGETALTNASASQRRPCAPTQQLQRQQLRQKAAARKQQLYNKHTSSSAAVAPRTASWSSCGSSACSSCGSSRPRRRRRGERATALSTQWQRDAPW